jgi:hypothetical protein
MTLESEPCWASTMPAWWWFAQKFWRKSMKPFIGRGMWPSLCLRPECERGMGPAPGARTGPGGNANGLDGTASSSSTAGESEAAASSDHVSGLTFGANWTRLASESRRRSLTEESEAGKAGGWLAMGPMLSAPCVHTDGGD